MNTEAKATEAGFGTVLEVEISAKASALSLSEASLLGSQMAMLSLCLHTAFAL